MDLTRTETGESLSKADFEALEGDLRVEVLNLQHDLRSCPRSLLVLLTGDDRLAIEDTFDRLHEWLDARRVDSEAFVEPRQEELERPLFWRYWNALPAHGRTGIFLGAWALRAVLQRVTGELKRKAFERRCEHARQLERDLAADGTALLKLYLHTPRAELEKRLKKARKKQRGSDRERARDAELLELHPEGVEVAGEYLAATEAPWAPWTVVEGTDDQVRDRDVLRALRDALRAAVEDAVPRPPVEPLPPPPDGGPGPLSSVDLSASLGDDAYDERLGAAQARLSGLSRAAHERGVSTVLVFEGPDAAGKGGAIRRLTRPISARDVKVVPIGAPTPEERAHHYLWRFWRRLPRAGQVVVFDRSWYGRVLVERVEGFASGAEWRRAYRELVDFEAQLVEHGVVLRKFWLQIDPDEQARRFRARRETPYKKYKYTDEDARNRARWADYERAADELLARTHTEEAPWLVVPANDKRFARVTVAEAVADALEARL